MILLSAILLTQAMASPLLAASEGRIGHNWQTEFALPKVCYRAIDFNERSFWANCSSELRDMTTEPKFERERNIWLVVSELRQGDLNAAYDDFAPLLDFDTWKNEDWSILILEGWLLNELNQYRKLEGLLSDVPREHADYAGSLIVRLNAYSLDGRQRKQEKLWQQIDPRTLDAWLWWHRSQHVSGDYKGQYLQQAIQTKPADSRHFNTYAKYLLRIDEPRQSMRILLQGLSAHPTSISLTSLAVAVSKEQNMLEWLEQQVLLFPEHTKMQWILGSVHLSNRDPDLAWNRFVQALNTGDSSLLLELSLRKSYSEAFTYPDKWADVFSIAQAYPENKFWIDSLLKLSEERDHRQEVLRHVQSLNKDKVEWVAEMIEYLTTNSDG